MSDLTHERTDKVICRVNFAAKTLRARISLHICTSECTYWIEMEEEEEEMEMGFSLFFLVLSE